MMISSANARNFTEKVKFLCVACRKSVGSNYIFGQFCTCQVDKGYTGIRGKLKVDNTFKCQT